ncbi:hypothetical protein WOLCODRAFT_138563 [Wolfiporia cocos MD-104 SS10]|uniref:F-box domain-containing protein n=1 Tax=Wolfiporia cocos (strain MD-104) TaxID=742152 RepID=A0A2H3K5P1_WOLCO|nr:hypothetical protein WOLCODRAFT_138563 [Wolfiporia cocos MD-104 SS10]
MVATELPMELWDMTISYLHDDLKALSACGQTCRAMVPIARPYLFRDISFSSDNELTVFDELLSSSPHLASYARSIRLLGVVREIPELRKLGLRQFAIWRHILPAFLDMLPAVTQLKAKHLYLHGPPLDNLIQLASPVKHLILEDCKFKDILDFSRLVASFPELEQITLERVCMEEMEDDENLFDSTPLPPPQLRQIALANMPDSSIVDWLLGEDNKIDSLVHQIGWNGITGSTMLEYMLVELGPYLRNLHLRVGTDADFDDFTGTYGPPEVSLTPCTALESCTLQIVLAQEFHRDSPELSWAPMLLAQLSAPELRTLVLRLVAPHMGGINRDGTWDYHRNTTVPFDDLSALDWPAIEAALARDACKGLRQFVLEGFGEAAALEATIKERCPQLHERGILLLRSVEFVMKQQDATNLGSR